MSSDLIERLKAASDRQCYAAENTADAFALHDMNAIDEATALLERQSELLEECREALPVFERVIRDASSLCEWTRPSGRSGDKDQNHAPELD